MNKKVFGDWASKYELVTTKMGYDDATRAKALDSMLIKKAYEVWNNALLSVKNDWKKIRTYLNLHFR